MAYDKDNDATRTGQAITNLLLIRYAQQQREQAEIQLEQLNMLRRHQGMAPLSRADFQPQRNPPAPGFRFLGACFWIAVSVALIVIVIAGSAEGSKPWLGVILVAIPGFMGLDRAVYWWGVCSANLRDYRAEQDAAAARAKEVEKRDQH